MAALEEGLITPSRKIDDPGHWEYGGREYQNAKKAVFGSIDVREALAKSSDIFFFKLGAQANDQGRVIQQLGRAASATAARPASTCRTRSPGLVPDRKWREQGLAAYEKCVEKAGVQPRTTEALFACGGIERGWSGGDNVNLAVGQGDLQATPLQVAVAYAALENGGTIVRPHLGKAIEDGNGVALQEFRPKPRRKIKMAARDRDAVLDGLRRAAQAEGGTSADVFAGWPMKRVPDLRQDGHRRAPAEPRPGLVRGLRPGQGAPDRGRRHRGEGRLRRGHRGTRGAHDPLGVVRCVRPRVPRGDQRHPMSAPIQPASEPPPSLVPREWRLRLDPLLLLATLGLVACSLIAIQGSTQDDARRSAVLRQAPGDLRGRRARADVRALAAGLLPPA